MELWKDPRPVHEPAQTPAPGAPARAQPACEFVDPLRADADCVVSPDATIAEEARNLEIMRERVQARAAEDPDARAFGWVAQVGAALRRARDRREVTQTVLSEKTSITQGYLSSMETGKLVRGPTIDVLYRYAAALGCECEITFRDRHSGHIVTSVQSSQASPAQAPAAEGAHHDPFTRRY